MIRREALAAETLVYDVAASCGPAGRVRLSHEARTCGQPPGASLNTPALTVSGAEAVGLPAFGALTVSPPRGIAAGDLYLAGDVALVGAVPPVTVERVCHFAPREAGALAVTCVGHDAASGCEGTLTPVAEAP